MKEEIKRALDLLGISPPVSIRDLKKIYRMRIREGGDVQSLSVAYKTLISFMERYPFKFSDDEIYRAYPEDRMTRRFGGIWGR